MFLSRIWGNLKARKDIEMDKTPLQMFEERNKKECCLNCENLIVKQTDKGHINFCGYCGKIILDRFLDCGNLRDCEYERKARY